MKNIIKIKYLLLLCVLVFPLEAVKYNKLDATTLYKRAIKYLDNENYKKADKVLKAYTKSKPNDSDGWNLYAFTKRKLGKYDLAEKYYKTSLALNPENKSALEYQGELFINTGRIDLARKNLVILENLCSSNCFEYEELKKSLIKATS